jgi:hypothetical protein
MPLTRLVTKLQERAARRQRARQKPLLAKENAIKYGQGMEGLFSLMRFVSDDKILNPRVEGSITRQISKARRFGKALLRQNISEREKQKIRAGLAKLEVLLAAARERHSAQKKV